MEENAVVAELRKLIEELKNRAEHDYEIAEEIRFEDPKEAEWLEGEATEMEKIATRLEHIMKMLHGGDIIGRCN